jgi:hypothetical protein
MMQTTWAGYDQNISIIEREPQQVSGYILAADYFWNPVNRNVNQLGYSPDKVLHHLWYGKTEDKTVQKGFAVNLSPYANMVLADNPNNRGFLKINPGYDLSNLLNGSQEDTLHLWDDVNYYISTRNHVPAGIALKGNGITKGFPDKVEGITINHKAHSLAFLHTTLFGALTSTPAGYYAVNYADGTHIEIPLIYGKNISGWRDIETYYGGQLSWQGTTSTGEPVYIRQYEWENPYPDKEIKSLDFHTGPASLSPLLIAITGIL